MDVKKLTEHQWWVLPPDKLDAKMNCASYNIVIGDQEDRVCELHEGECSPKEFAEAIVLMQNDQCVKQRRGWHTEKCGINQWCVPQAVEVMRKNFLNGKDRAIAEAACYQEVHDIGLLSKADAWYERHVEAKETT